MNGEPRAAILQVRLSPPTPAGSSTIETKSGAVRWGLLEDTLHIQPERKGVLGDSAHVERLVRTVMRRSGLARRYHVFAMAADAMDGPMQANSR
ncbi:MAG: hypothetical protein ACOC2D_14885 [Spirochaetota bacterium]